MTLDSILAQRLQTRRDEHRYRVRRTVQSPQGVHIKVDSRDVLCFCSNDYLGLANHPDLILAMQTAAARYGVGSGASHLVCGHSHEHHQLEEELAHFTGRARALLFSSGYMANMGVIAGLLGRTDAVFEDRLNHASLLDGGLLSGAQFQRFAHNNPADLSRRLEKSSAPNKLVVVDGVYSMDGDLAPLPELAALARKHQAWLMVDDAHGFGYLGKTGAGVCEHYGLTEADVPVLMGTLGKAFGSAGAFVAGSENLIEALIQFARTYIYTTAIPPAVAAASRASLQIVQQEPARRERLLSLIALFRKGAESLGLPVIASPSAIQPVVVGDDSRALAWSEKLLQHGCWVGAIRPPTVPEGSARLRITLSANHTEAHIEQLLNGLADCLEL